MLRQEPETVGKVATEQAPKIQTGNAQIQVLSITGLTGTDVGSAQTAIAQQLKSVNLPAGFNGVMILEITIQNGRLTRIILDDVASAVKDQNFVELIKRSLQNVVLPSTAKGNIRLTLNINS
jgi:Ca-activated chloride channel family protein